MQMAATAFITYPSGDANMQVHIKIRIQRSTVSSEAMHHCAGNVVPVMAQNIDQYLARLTFMQKHGQLQFGCQLQLCFECFDLLGTG